ncbi:hypothetical protein V8C34DRAFT_277632 [Trichoderma compactum]
MGKRAAPSYLFTRHEARLPERATVLFNGPIGPEIASPMVCLTLCNDEKKKNSLTINAQLLLSFPAGCLRFSCANGRRCFGVGDWVLGQGTGTCTGGEKYMRIPRTSSVKTTAIQTCTRLSSYSYSSIRIMPMTPSGGVIVVGIGGWSRNVSLNRGVSNQ